MRWWESGICANLCLKLSAGAVLQTAVLPPTALLDRTFAVLVLTTNFHRDKYKNAISSQKCHISIFVHFFLCKNVSFTKTYCKNVKLMQLFCLQQNFVDQCNSVIISNCRCKFMQQWWDAKLSRIADISALNFAYRMQMSFLHQKSVKSDIFGVSCFIAFCVLVLSFVLSKVSSC